MTRCTETHTWPAFAYPPAATAPDASSRSASGRTITGQEAPSSSESFLTPAVRAIRSPTALDPVKDTLRIRGSPTSRSPISSPCPVTTLSTPGGRPASTKHAASANAVNGVVSAGLRTTALPAATRRRDLVHDQQTGVVERGDRQHHPARLADGEPHLVQARPRRRVQRERRAVDVRALERGQPDRLGAPPRLRARLGDRLSVLARRSSRRSPPPAPRRGRPPAARPPTARARACDATGPPRPPRRAPRPRRRRARPAAPRPRPSRRTASGSPRCDPTPRPATRPRPASLHPSSRPELSGFRVRGWVGRLRGSRSRSPRWPG